MAAHADTAGCAQVVKVVMPAAKEGRPHREYGFVHFTERATAVKLAIEFGFSERD